MPKCHHLEVLLLGPSQDSLAPTWIPASPSRSCSVLSSPPCLGPQSGWSPACVRGRRRAGRPAWGSGVWSSGVCQLGGACEMQGVACEMQGGARETQGGACEMWGGARETRGGAPSGQSCWAWEAPLRADGGPVQAACPHMHPSHGKMKTWRLWLSRGEGLTSLRKWWQAVVRVIRNNCRSALTNLGREVSLSPWSRAVFGLPFLNKVVSP